MAHLTGRQRTQRTRRPTTSPHGHTPLPRPTPPAPGPPTAGTPTPTAPAGASPPGLRQRPARRTYRPQRTAGRCPSGTTPHQPDRRLDRQNCHLPAARPPAQAPARIRHAPPPRRTPRSPRTRGAYPGCHPWREATPGGHRRRRTMAPNRLHRGPNRSATRPRWARKDCRDLRNKRRHHTNGGAWRGNGPDISAECRRDERNGTQRRRGIDRWPP